MELVADDTYVTAAEAADMLRVSVRTVERLRADGELEPVYIRTGGKAILRRFRRSDVEARVAATRTVLSA